jgi:Flp pilus assembly pilin Flp
MFQTIRRKCRQRDERGAALVEFALLLPVLAALLLGTVTGGMAYNRKISMTNAIREGSRFGATLDGSADWDAAATTVRTRVYDIAGGDDGDLELDQICVSYLHVGVSTPVGEAAGCAAGADPNPLTSASAGDCVVSVWAQRETTLQVFFFTRDIDLEARAVARYERAPSC